MTDLLTWIVRALGDGALQPGTVNTVLVEHATSCRLLSGGTCSCIPTVTLTTPAGIHSVDHQDNLEKGTKQ